MKPGTYAVNLATGEVRLIIEYSRHHRQVTFSGDSKWYSATEWECPHGVPRPAYCSDCVDNAIEDFAYSHIR